MTAADGPQQTPAAAYRHASTMAAQIAAQARRESRGPSVPCFVRVERVEHLAAGLAARAEEAQR